MKNIHLLSFFLLVFLLFSCKAKYPYKYIAYEFDPKLKLPSEKLELLFINDSTGYFLNYLTKENIFKQKFIYNNSNVNIIHIKRVDTINENIISLKVNVNIVAAKDKMCFLFKGNFIAPLCFEKEKD